MGYPYYIIDSFTDVAFGGVPVAVFPEADAIPEAYHKALSEEVVACDTVFIKHSDIESHRYSFLSFDQDGACMPGAHALIAGLAALVGQGSETNTSRSSIKLDTIEDCIDADHDPSSKRYPFVLKRRINAEIDQFVPNKEDIAQIVGLDATEIVTRRYHCAISNCDSPYLVVPLKNYQCLYKAKLNPAAWSASSLPSSLVAKILLFTSSTDRSGTDIHMRMLTLNAPINSDPAIGEAMPAFAGYLAKQKYIQKGTHSLSIRRGENLARQSIIQLEFDKAEDGPLQIRIGGSAVMTSKGEITAV